jgi:hypothetical protein
MVERRFAVVVMGAAMGFVLLACGDDGERGIRTDTSDTTGDTTSDTSEGDTLADTGDTSTPRPNECGEARACAQGSCRSGVCVQDPPAGANAYLTDPVENLLSNQWPDLSCVDTAAEAAMPVETRTTTMYGAVARFGKGRKTIDIKVEVLLADGFDPSACEEETTAAAKRTCYRNYGTPIASTLSVAPPTPASLPESCTKHEECPLGYQCFDPAELGGDCEEQFGLYELAGVPLNTPLIIRSYATTNEAQWHDTWMFNVILDPAREVSGRTQYDAQMVSHGQWLLTSNSVGLPDMSPNNGAIGGRIRDCQGDRPYAWPISEVRLNLAQPGSGIVYFNNLEDDTVPLIDRQTTDILGRFAALDVPAGWNRMAGAARVDGQVVSVGSTAVYVIPNSLSIVSWPGSQPYWRQQ